MTLDKHLTSLSYSYFNIKRVLTHKVVLTVLFTIPCGYLWSLAQLLPLHGPVSYNLLFSKFKAHSYLTLIPRTPAHSHLFLLWTRIADVFIFIQQKQSGKVTETARPWLCSQTDLIPLSSWFYDLASLSVKWGWYYWSCITDIKLQWGNIYSWHIIGIPSNLQLCSIVRAHLCYLSNEILI